jgi:predicted nuclease of restriction endonuclease-like (RecB) superfamily
MAKKKNMLSVPESDYISLLAGIKQRIAESRVRAATAVNRELVDLYWEIGKQIMERQELHGWGSSVIERLSADLIRELPGSKGFSASNLWRMRNFYAAYPDQSTILAEALRELPWYHNLILLEKIKNQDEKLWYARAAKDHGWSGPVLIHQIESDLFHRSGKALQNFDRTLPPPQSDPAKSLLRDPYSLEFLEVDFALGERKIERALIARMKDFLVELGKGFAFVGSQYHLEVGGQDFYLDLLFYHLTLRSFIAIELKTEEFKPEFAGKMNFYLSAIDDRLRRNEDRPSIGLILCKSKNNIVVEYTLRDTSKPMGVAEYTLGRSLPANLRDALPEPEEIELAMRSFDEFKK